MACKLSANDLRKRGYNPVYIVSQDGYWTGRYFINCKRLALAISSMEIAQGYIIQYNLIATIEKA